MALCVSGTCFIWIKLLTLQRLANGARLYYLNRSHPPFLTEMVKEYYAKTHDDDFLNHALPVLDKEYTFWKTNTSVQLTDPTTGSHYQLNRYIVNNDAPRPESYSEDYDTAYLNTDYNDEQLYELFSNLAAGAESGWDYSSRWTKSKASHDPHGYDILRTLNVHNIIPVDLNSLLYSMETTLATWHRDGSAKQKYYKRQAAKRLEAMDRFLWDQDAVSFFDYNLTSQSRNHDFTPANLFPFW